MEDTRTTRQQEFKLVLKDIAAQLSPEDVVKLKFLYSDNTCAAGNESALNLLWGLVCKGKYNHSCPGGLQKLLRDIDRSDLITSYLEGYTQRFTTQTHNDPWPWSCGSEGARIYSHGNTSAPSLSSHPPLPHTMPHSGSHSILEPHSTSNPIPEESNEPKSLMVGTGHHWIVREDDSPPSSHNHHGNDHSGKSNPSLQERVNHVTTGVNHVTTGSHTLTQSAHHHATQTHSHHHDDPPFDGRRLSCDHHNPSDDRRYHDNPRSDVRGLSRDPLADVMGLSCDNEPTMWHLSGCDLSNSTQSLPPAINRATNICDTSYYSVQDMTAGCLGSGTKTYRDEHVVSIKTSHLCPFIGKKVGKSIIHFTMKINVYCKCSRHRRLPVKVKVIPHPLLEERGVGVEAELIIPRKCSRHKWLVDYTHSHLRVCTIVCHARTHKQLYKKESMTEISGSHDNKTLVLLRDVLPHTAVLYEAAETYTLHVIAEIVVTGYKADHTASGFQLVPRDGDFLEVTPLPIPSGAV